MKRMSSVAAAAIVAAALGGCGGGETDSGTSGPPLPAQAVGEKERCWDKAGQVAALAQPSLGRDVLVLVDQTTQLPQDVRKAVVEELERLADPGTRLSIGTFSSYTESAHSQVVFESVLEPGFPQAKRNDAPMKGLRNLEACLGERRATETARLKSSIMEAMEANRPDVQRSDVLANVKSFAQRIKGSAAQDKILILVSDLLENSSAMSFYGSGALRRLDPAAELERAKQNDLMADLAGLRIYVVGAGLLPPDARSSRTLEELRALEAFWKSYFEASGATSADIGKPRLLSPID